MLRIWGKLWDKGKIKESLTVEDAHTEWTLEDRIDRCEDELARAFDLARPIWFPKNRQEMKNFRSTRFDQSNFIEHFPHQYFEMDIVGTDEDDVEKTGVSV